MKHLAIITLLLSFMCGCKKEKQETRGDILIKHTWVRDKYYINDVEQKIDSCKLDDTYKFNAENYLLVIDNVNRCVFSDDYNNPYLYALSADEKVLQISRRFGVIQYEILAISHERLEITTNAGAYKETFKAID
jgi:hypothetical protein